MKRRFKMFLSLTLCLMMVLGGFTIGGDGLANSLGVFTVKANASKITEYKMGDIIEFGWYPQSQETDPTVISELNEIAGDDSDWTSYNYYSGNGTYADGQMEPSNYMRYKDVDFGAAKYRGVVFDSYRPNSTQSVSSADNSRQDDNGYTIGTIYWFIYESIKWRVLDPSIGLVLSETILDSQAYNNYIIGEDDEDKSYYSITHWGDSAKTYYANNYANSSIRQWLNNDFYNTAFSTSQQDIIQLTTLDNTYETSNSEYDSESTTDKIFMLSYSDIINGNYGFGSDSSRTAQGSDYAKCQGIFVYSGNGNSNWRLRSAGSHSSGTCHVGEDGCIGDYEGADNTELGVRPALKLNLASDIFQSSVSEIGETYTDNNEKNIESDNEKATGENYKGDVSDEVISSAENNENGINLLIVFAIAMIAIIVLMIIILKKKKKK